MISFFIILVFIGLAYHSLVRFIQRHQKEVRQTGKGHKAAALPRFYGYIAATMMLSILVVFLILFGSFGAALTTWLNELLSHTLTGTDYLYAGLLVVGLLSLSIFPLFLRPTVRARHIIERGGRVLFLGAALVAVLVTSIAVILLLKESLHFFKLVSLQDFLGGRVWAPEISYGSEEGFQKGADAGHYGALPLFTGTFLITGIAMLVGGGLGLMVAIYTSQFAKSTTRTFLKPALEILAGIPTVVYGFFALTFVAPTLQALGEIFHVSISSESALGAGLVMGLMILPIISSLCDDALTSLPSALKQNALAMGATATEAIRSVLVPAAFPGITASFLLAISRATGETMLVLMAASLQPHLTGNPLEAVTTVTVQIVSLLTGDQEFESPKTLSAFALALVLFLVTLFLNVLALFFVNRHAKRYEL